MVSFNITFTDDEKEILRKHRLVINENVRLYAPFVSYENLINEGSSPRFFECLDFDWSGTSWKDLLSEFSAWFCQQGFTRSELLSMNPFFSRVPIFSAEKKTNHYGPFTYGVYFNANRTSLHYWWVMIHMLEQLPHEYKDSTLLLVHYPSALEPPEVTRILWSKEIRVFRDFIRGLGYSPEKVGEYVENIKKLNAVYKEIAPNYYFFLQDIQSDIVNSISRIRKHRSFKYDLENLSLTIDKFKDFKSEVYYSDFDFRLDIDSSTSNQIIDIDFSSLNINRSKQKLPRNDNSKKTMPSSLASAIIEVIRVVGDFKNSEIRAKARTILSFLRGSQTSPHYEHFFTQHSLLCGAYPKLNANELAIELERMVKLGVLTLRDEVYFWNAKPDKDFGTTVSSTATKSDNTRSFIEQLPLSQRVDFLLFKNLFSTVAECISYTISSSEVSITVPVRRALDFECKISREGDVVFLSFTSSVSSSKVLYKEEFKQTNFESFFQAFRSEFDQLREVEICKPLGRENAIKKVKGHFAEWSFSLVNYARIDNSNDSFYVSPPKECLETNWLIILDDFPRKLLIVLSIPSRAMLHMNWKKGTSVPYDSEPVRSGHYAFVVLKDTLNIKDSEISFKKFFHSYIDY